jgi:hypothetical protein
MMYQFIYVFLFYFFSFLTLREIVGSFRDEMKMSMVRGFLIVCNGDLLKYVALLFTLPDINALAKITIVHYW